MKRIVYYFIDFPRFKGLNAALDEIFVFITPNYQYSDIV